MTQPDSYEPTLDLHDPHQWLEDITGEAALRWVRARNAECAQALDDGAAFVALKQRLLAIFDSDARIAYIGKHGQFYYNFWRDREHARGLWRRTTLAEYKNEVPCWEHVLDLDALATTEGENWQWSGVAWLEPDHSRCLVRLSRAGGDAIVVREFDVEQRKFIADGFNLEQAKSRVAFIDRDTLYVATDFGQGSLTQSGYPRIVKRWKRGRPLSEAETVFEGTPSDVSVGAWRDHTKGFERDIVHRSIGMTANEVYVIRDGKLVKLDKPDDADASLHQKWLFLQLRSDYEVAERSYSPGTLLAIELEAFLTGSRDFRLLFEPQARTSLAWFGCTKNYLLLNVLDNVRSRVSVLRVGAGDFLAEPLPGVPTVASVAAWAVDPRESDDYFLTTTDYLTAPSLILATVGAPTPTTTKHTPAYFRTDGLEIQQFEARSADGTSVPYFQISKRDLVHDGKNPTLLWGYGGFEISMVPGYSATVGTAWLEQGGTYIVANIRGGGEFGPEWHKAALRARRPRAFEDFSAVADDLIARRVTSPPRLGCMGGSNGGLLVGNMLTQYPDRFGAIVCSMPLLDMRRFHQLLAGASWVDEYGDPDNPIDWQSIRGFSPYHNLDVGRRYPPVLFLSSTRDDRVHPGHGRKMVARMVALGIPQVLYYENIEGGHAGAANNEQSAYKSALTYSFLRKWLFSD